ncbi:MAG: MlaD family protein, partial [Burkholderiaceae bacterium]
VGCLIVFGSGRFFEKTLPFVAFFEGSLSGLSVGAPVTFRGIPIGSVTDVKVQLFPKDMTERIPVYFDVVPEKLEIMGEVTGTRQERIKQLIDVGMRAQLVPQSLVTGQLGIEISMQPGTAVKLVGGDPSVVEMPTVPSPIQQLMGELQKIKLDQLVESANALITQVATIVSAPEVQELAPEVASLIAEARTLLVDLDAEIKPTVTSLRGATDAAKMMLDQGQDTLAKIDAGLSPAIADVRQLVRELDAGLPATLRRLDATLAAVDASVKPESAVMKDVRSALSQVANAARSLRKLADTLERDPSALIRGK